MSCIIDLLRHGEVDGGLCLGNASDPPLNARGWSQMRDATSINAGWQAVVSSPLQRCRAFAEELAARLDLPLRIDARLAELGFGAWEGRPWTELYASHAEALLRFQRTPGDNPAPGGEHFADFEGRVRMAWAELGHQGENRQVLVVCHAGIIRAILRQVLEMPLTSLFRIDVPHGGLTRLVCEADGTARLVFHRQP